MTEFREQDLTGSRFESREPAGRHVRPSAPDGVEHAQRRSEQGTVPQRPLQRQPDARRRAGRRGDRLRPPQRDGERCRHRAARRGRTGPPDAGPGQDACPRRRRISARLGRSWKSFGPAPSRGPRRSPRLRSTAASTGNGRSSRRCGISTSPARRWVGRMIAGNPSPWHPLDLPWDEAPGWDGIPGIAMRGRHSTRYSPCEVSVRQWCGTCWRRSPTHSSPSSGHPHRTGLAPTGELPVAGLSPHRRQRGVAAPAVRRTGSVGTRIG